MASGCCGVKGTQFCDRVADDQDKKCFLCGRVADDQDKKCFLCGRVADDQDKKCFLCGRVTDDQDKKCFLCGRVTDDQDKKCFLCGRVTDDQDKKCFLCGRVDRYMTRFTNWKSNEKEFVLQHVVNTPSDSSYMCKKCKLEAKRYHDTPLCSKTATPKHTRKCIHPQCMATEKLIHAFV